MDSRRLALKREPLHELSAGELGGVVGGITTLQLKSLQDCPGLEQLPTFPVLYCATEAIR